MNIQTAKWRKNFATGKLLAGLKIEKIYLKIKSKLKQIKSNKKIPLHKIYYAIKYIFSIYLLTILNRKRVP